MGNIERPRKRGVSHYIAFGYYYKLVPVRMKVLWSREVIHLLDVADIQTSRCDLSFTAIVPYSPDLAALNRLTFLGCGGALALV